MSATTSSNDPFKEAHRRSLIYWVNSFNNPNCLLASSSIDFKNGVIFCELIGALRGRPLTEIIHDTSASIDSSLTNISLAINELKRLGIQRVQGLTAESVYNSEDCMYELLETIKQAFEMSAKVEETETARYQPQIHTESHKKLMQSPEFAAKQVEVTQKTLEKSQSYTKSRKMPAEIGITEEEIALGLKQGILLDHNGKYLTFPKSTPPLSGLERHAYPELPQRVTRNVTTIASPHKTDFPMQSARTTKRSVEHKLSRNHSQTPYKAKPSCFKSISDLEDLEPMNIPKVELRTKHKILEWLQDIQLVKEAAVTVAEFPHYCRNGVLLADLISRVEGSRKTTLRGIMRSPKSSTEILSNLRKCLRHLRNYEKMNSRYLWAEKYILKGNEDVIYGLLDDMWYFYHGKVSPYFVGTSRRRREEMSPSEGMRTTPLRHTRRGLSPDYDVPGELPPRVPSHSPVLRKTSSKPQPRPGSMQPRKSPFRSTTEAVQRTPLRNSHTEKELRSPQFPKVVPENEKQTRIWLKSLGLTVLPSQESGEILYNPYRNGTLLCELFEVLEGCKVPTKTLNPITVNQAQHNVKQALNAFQEIHPHEIPHYFFSPNSIQEMLKGNKDVIWGLLSTIKEMYPQTEPRRQPYLHLENIGLPYTVDDLRRLEISILHWLKTIGVLGKVYSGRNQPVTILEIENEIRNGTLFCELAELLSGTRLHGVFKEPKSDSTCLVNLRKAFERLRSLPKISHRYLWTEKEVFKGNRGIIFAVLEELHKYFDGVIEAPSRSTQKLTPYLGRDNIDGTTMNYSYMVQGGVSQGPQFFPQQSSKHQATSPPHQRQDNTLDLLPADIPPPREPVPTIKENTLGSTFGSGSVLELNPNNTLKLIRVPRGPSRLPPRPQKKLFTFSRLADITPKPYPASTKAKADPRFSQPSLRFESTLELEEKHNRSASKNELNKLTEWLEMIGTKLPDYFTLDAPVLETFKDGVLLCQIVGILEKKRIEGVCSKPTSSASAMHNIRKALEVLHKKKSIPLEYLGAVEDIYKGDPDAIIGLLKHVRNAYKNYYQHLEQHRNTIQIRSKVLSMSSKDLPLKNAKAPFGTVDAAGLDNTESLNTSLSKIERKKFLLSPQKAWN